MHRAPDPVGLLNNAIWCVEVHGGVDIAQASTALIDGQDLVNSEQPSAGNEVQDSHWHADLDSPHRSV